MSSRNAYLNPSQRTDALILFRALEAGRSIFISEPSASATSISKAAKNNITKSIENSGGKVTLDYLNLVNPETLQDLKDSDSANGGVLVGAIFLKRPDRTIRLIDNFILNWGIWIMYTRK